MALRLWSSQCPWRFGLCRRSVRGRLGVGPRSVLDVFGDCFFGVALSRAPAVFTGALGLVSTVSPALWRLPLRRSSSEGPSSVRGRLGAGLDSVLGALATAAPALLLRGSSQCSRFRRVRKTGSVPRCGIKLKREEKKNTDTKRKK